ncbi:hypothetical protein [Dactylosporangium fulvum]|uniref:LPXTG cell wall anchor domain-containing protein n=1 Tax=Dactylosporangium fulvum TaxID=53359 RepID=A0ABY5VN77_9ACTN|nr:hypothetical protein [Dactylosporangium fulvum]UWP78910.1 hypothetical protein Dfulv_27480 [Dactylosporangium fulvum]
MRRWEMYEGGVAGGAAGSAALLPVTGLSIGWQLVLGATLILGGMALLRLAPRPQRRRS